MSALRLIGECWPPNLYYESHPTGTAFHGRGMWVLKEMEPRIPQIEVVTNLSSSETNYPAIQTLIDGKADLSTNNWGVSYRRSKLVDFSYPQYITGIYIYSGRTENRALGNVFFGVFDFWSCFFILLAMASMTTLLWILIKRQRPQQGFSFAAAATYTFGNCLDQPLCNAVIPMSTFGRSLFIFFSIYNFIISIMYGSVIIAMLTNRAQLGSINDLEDLLKPNNNHLRIWINERSFVKDHLSGMEIFRSLKNRIDFFKKQNGEGKTVYNIDILQSVTNDSHVIIDTNNNVMGLMQEIHAETGVCSFSERDFRRSRDPLFNTAAAWMYRKGMHFTEEVNKELMWLEAFGLLGRSGVNKNRGIWSSKLMDHPCDAVISSEEACKSPTAEIVSNQSQYAPLNLQHFWKIFQIYGILMALALLVFLSEIVKVPPLKRVDKMESWNKYMDN